VITTNFDRLIERAVSEAGVEAQVLTGEADLQAMLPIQHTKCTIVKLHGDYQKANLLNVEDELDQYPENLARLLNRVLDEYGLFAIGWSGETDTALCRAIRATSQNPFGRYFGVRHEPSSQIQDFVATQKGVAMPISTGDEFFDRLVARSRRSRTVHSDRSNWRRSLGRRNVCCRRAARESNCESCFSEKPDS
jgi:hypothetical protein